MWKLVIEKAGEEANSNCFALMFSGGRGRDVGFQLKVSLSETCARFEGLRLHLIKGQRVARRFLNVLNVEHQNGKSCRLRGEVLRRSIQC